MVPRREAASLSDKDPSSKSRLLGPKTTPGLMIIGVVVAVTAVIAGGSIIAAAGHRSVDAGLVEGDRAELHLRIFDAKGSLLYSTRSSDLPELNWTQQNWTGPFVVPASDLDHPTHINVTSDLRPRMLDNGTFVFGLNLLGKKTGDILTVPVQGHFEGYDQEVTLERDRGPFNRTMPATRDALAALTTSSDGKTVQLDDAFSGTVEDLNETMAQVHITTPVGTLVRVAHTPFTATVTAAGPDQFGLRLDGEAGKQFTLLKTCEFGRYVLPVGSYRIASVTETTITLAKSPTKWPQLIDRDLFMVFEVTGKVVS